MVSKYVRKFLVKTLDNTRWLGLLPYTSPTILVHGRVFPVGEGFLHRCLMFMSCCLRCPLHGRPISPSIYSLSVPSSLRTYSFTTVTSPLRTYSCEPQLFVSRLTLCSRDVGESSPRVTRPRHVTPTSRHNRCRISPVPPTTPGGPVRRGILLRIYPSPFSRSWSHREFLVHQTPV